ncbi:MAG: HDOD domain-containing protein [Desulfovibrionaceae bacterium]|nr:HDOD domain-containing protein [Desulfovibrionaceae bacterium]
MSLPTSYSENVFIARQPVFYSNETVWGYELLFRSGEENVALVQDDDQATSAVIADGLALALVGMQGSARVLINFPENMLTGDVGFALPRDKCVVEILENVRPCKKTLAAARRLKEAGYILAVDDFFGQPELRPFIDLADIIKVDVLALDADVERVAKVVESLPHGPTLLAEKVEDIETFHKLKELGFLLFQGFFFSRPEIIPGRKLTSNEMTKLQLLNELSKPEFEPSRLAEILSSDPSLSYRLFRYINSVGMGLRQKVTSLKRAIDMMGMLQAKQWLRTALVADLVTSPKAGELAYLAVHRARFLEQVCQLSNRKTCEPDALFMTGLFSLLDAMLGLNMEDILKVLPLEEKVVRALLGEGEFHELLDLAASYERGRWSEALDHLKRLDLEGIQAESLYVQSRGWTQRMLGLTEEE